MYVFINDTHTHIYIHILHIIHTRIFYAHSVNPISYIFLYYILITSSLRSLISSSIGFPSCRFCGRLPSLPSWRPSGWSQEPLAVHQRRRAAGRGLAEPRAGHMDFWIVKDGDFTQQKWGFHQAFFFWSKKDGLRTKGRVIWKQTEISYVSGIDYYKGAETAGSRPVGGRFSVPQSPKLWQFYNVWG